MQRIQRVAWLVVGVIALGLLSFGPANAAPALPRTPLDAQKAHTPDSGLTLVHGWHCSTRYNSRWGWHRHPRACRNNRYRSHRYNSSRYQRDRYRRNWNQRNWSQRNRSNQRNRTNQRNRSNQQRNNRSNRGTNQRNRGNRNRRDRGPVHSKARTQSYRDYKDKF